MHPYIGDRFPNIELPLLSGDRLATDALRGTRTLLFFWGSW